MSWVRLLATRTCGRACALRSVRRRESFTDMQRRTPTSSSEVLTSTVSRFGMWFVVLMLVAAVGALTVATVQARSGARDYGVRDRIAATDTAAFLKEHLERRRTEQNTFLTAHRDAFASRDRASLQARIEDRFLETAAEDVVGAAVTDTDGRVLVLAEREPGAVGNIAKLGRVRAAARAAAMDGKPGVTGRLGSDAAPMIGDARSLSDIGGAYGAWVVFYDMTVGPVGTFVAHDAHRELPVVTVRDRDGKLIVGPTNLPAEDSRPGIPGGATTKSVPATNWQVVVPPTPIPAGIPVWIYGALVVGIVMLGCLYWLQESARKSLRSEADIRERETQRLYSLAADLLNSSTTHDQAALLAAAAQDATGVDLVRVRIAADRSHQGYEAGQLHPDAELRTYRVAVTGPGKPSGEMLLCTDTEPASGHARRIARTMAALTGAAMHTLSVLERERDAAEELLRVDELRTNLMSTIAHELRSPMTAVKGVLSLLQMQTDLPAKSREYVEVANERANALVALIRDLFDVSLLESGQLEVRPERVVASELLDRSLAAVAAAHPGELLLSATENLKVTVDPIRFDQIVNNIVTNAFRHGRPPIEVAVRPYAEGACVVITDNGPGIPEAERQRIFSKFYQSDSGHARLVDGAGLGLALVHGLVALHGGRIDVDAAHLDGRGARFTIFLPDVAADGAIVPIAQQDFGTPLDVPDLGSATDGLMGTG